MSSLPFDLVRPSRAEPTNASAIRRLPPTRTAGLSRAPYLLDATVATAVNVAIALEQPLLVTGEPGTGKTMLAWEIARQLGTDVLEFHTKSTSTARDLLYSFDTVRRFHDASSHDERARDASQYVTYQALGEAIRSDRTRVVLVDEIDKAPRDFPNDLLREMDRMEFDVPEIAPTPTFRAQVAHLVLITSNSERRLPEPFLRRCVFAHIPFPDGPTLERIVAAHLADVSPAPSFVGLVVRRFEELRGVDGLAKRPGTSELVGWARVLLRMGVTEEDLRASDLRGLPVLVALLKHREDIERMADRG